MNNGIEREGETSTFHYTPTDIYEITVKNPQQLKKLISKDVVVPWRAQCLVVLFEFTHQCIKVWS